MSKKITIKGKVYDMEELADAVAVQKLLTPDNWSGTKADCVRHFLSAQNMLALQFRRHLAASWKNLCGAAMAERENGSEPQIALSFAFTLDLTAPTVVAIRKTKLGFSVPFVTTGAPQTHDINQGEFLTDDMEVVLNVAAFNAEAEAAAAAKESPAPDEDKPASEAKADPTAGGDVTAENTPGDEGKKKRSHKKKN